MNLKALRAFKRTGHAFLALFMVVLVSTFSTTPAQAFAGTLENGNMAYAQGSGFDKGEACNYLPGFETGYDAWHFVLTTRGATFQQASTNPAIAVNLNFVFMRQDGSLFVIKSGAWVQTGKGAYTYTLVQDRIRMVQAGTVAQINGSDSGMRLSHTCPGSGSATTSSPSPTPTATTASPSPTPTATATRSASPSPSQSATTTSPSPTATATRSTTPSPTPTTSASPTPTASASRSASPTPSSSPSPSASLTPSPSPSTSSSSLPTLRPRPNPTASAIQIRPSQGPNRYALPTPTPTPQGLTSPTPTPSASPSRSASPSPTTSSSPTPTPSVSPSVEPSLAPPVLPTPPPVQDPEKTIYVDPQTPKEITPEEKPATPIVITKEPQYGTATINNNGTITYTPSAIQPAKPVVDVIEYKYTNLAGETIIVRKEIVVTQKGDVPSIIQTGGEDSSSNNGLLSVILITMAALFIRKGVARG
jgi:hypothetical protein